MKQKLLSLSFWKWLVVVLAVGNLIFLFVFNYQLPGFLRPSSSSETVAEVGTTASVPSEDVVSSLQIQFPTEALVYDGTGTLDLMDGVSVLDGFGETQTNINVFSTIKAGSSSKEKIIEYSITDSNGNRITAERQLNLGEQYTGPFIEIYGEMPNLSTDDIQILVSLLINNNLIYADDGFGADITSYVTSSIKSSADESGNTIVTLSITNMVNDSYSTDVTVYTGTNSGPVIKLTTNTDILNVGDEFNFYKYLDYAHDKDGEDLSHRIHIDGTIDTSTPGQYTVEFYCTDPEGNVSPKEPLTITVR